MKRWLLLGVMMMTTFGWVHAYDMTPTPDAVAEEYVVGLAATPETIEANKPFTLTLTVYKADGKTPVVNFDEVHTKLLHLILVSEDLTQFLHVHPDYQGNGVFVLKDLVLSQAARYVTYADFTPTGDVQHYVRGTLVSSGAQTKEPQLVITPLEVTVGNLKMQLDTSTAFKAGEENPLKFHVSDPKTGQAVSNLDEYLGAAGHLVIIDQSNQIYIHTHPAGHDLAGMSGMSGMDNMATATPEMSGMAMPMLYGPDLEFMADFPSSGKWAMWLQVQYQGEVLTFPFVIEVTGMADGTPSAHAHS